MAKKKVNSENESKVGSSRVLRSGTPKRGNISENKDISNSGGSGRVLRSAKATKGGENADEKGNGKKPFVRRGSLTIKDDGAQKGEHSRKRKVATQEGNPAKRSRKASEKEKGKRVVSGGKLSEKAQGKRKIVSEEGNEGKSSTPAARKSASLKITVSNVSSAEKGPYNLRARKAVPFFQKVGLSESGLSQVVGKRVKVLKSGSRKWVTGEIKSYNKRKKRHNVLYVDGGSEELDMKTERFEVELMPGEAFTLGLKPGEKTATNVDKKGSSAQPQKMGNAEKKAANVGSKKTVSCGGSAAKTKPSQRAKKDEGPANVEKRENPPRKGRAGANTKK